MALVFDDPDTDRAGARGGAAEDDPVRRYLKEIGKVPLLTAGQEVELCRRIEAAETGLRRALVAIPEGLAALLEAGAALRRGEVPADEVIALTDRSEVEPADVRAAVRGFARMRRLAASRQARKLVALADTAADIPLSPMLVARIVADVLSRSAGAGESARRRAARAELKRCQRAIRDGKRALTEANLRLVVAVAKRYIGGPLALLDLVQEGNLGLMRAVDRFQYRRGFKFSTYATWWIRQGVTRALADQARTVRIPVHMVETLHRVRRVEQALADRRGEAPALEDIARGAGIAVGKLRLLQDAARPPLPLETPVGDDSVLGDFLEDRGAPTPVDGIIREDLVRQLRRSMVTLSPRERAILTMRFGLDDEDEHTLEQVGARFAVTRERIRQVEAKALRKLRRPLRSHHLVPFVQER